MRLLAALLLTACASAPPIGPRSPERDAPLVLSEGSCAGLAEAPLADPVGLLEGRLTVRPPRADVTVSALPFQGLQSPRAAAPDAETLLIVEPEEGGRLLVWTRERFQRVASGGLLEAVRGLLSHDPRIAVRPLENDTLEAVAAIPRTPISEHGTHRLAAIYTRTPDGLVEETEIHADPETAAAAGCQRLALRIGETLTPGRRRLPIVGGRVALRPGLTIELPGEHAVEVRNGRDHAVYALHPITELADGEPTGYLGIRIGPSPAFAPPEGSRHWEEPLVGVNARWYQARFLDTRVREGLAQVPGLGPVHVYMGAATRAELEPLQALAATLSTDTPPDPLPGCEAFDARAPVPSPALAEDPDVQALATAERFVRSTIAFGDGERALVAAFRRLAARVDAGQVFEHLAAQEATVARLYGLAGLAAIEDAAFRPIFCAVAPNVTGTVPVTDLCETTEVGVGAILEVAEASVDPGFWRARQWRATPGPRDLWGRGLGRELRWGPLVDPAVATAARRLDGVPWPTEPGPFAADRRAAPIQLGVGQLCGTRRDGRWACWGREGEWLYPDHVRHPSAVAGAYSPCFVDREGRRTCAGAALDAALQLRAQVCGGEPPTPRTAFRSFDDGPWTLFDLGLDACGVDAEGALHCFETRTEHRPGWVAGPPGSFAGAWRVPIRGRVVGAAKGHGTARWAWTEEGRVVRWNDRDPPRVVAQLDGLARIVAGMRVTFAEMADGRVLGLGPQPGEPWWDVVGQLGHEWVELPELHGARLTVDAYHGCALFDRGRVRCWGSNEAGQVGATGQRRAPLTEVAALRGARSLHLSPGATCARLRGDRLRCIGEGARFLGDPDRHGHVEVRLQRRADAVRESRAASTEDAPNAERPPPE